MQVAPATSAAVVQVTGVVKEFGTLRVLDGVSLDVARGQTVAIVGRSGSGKSTLLRCIAGLETIQAGKIEVCGHEVGRPGKAARAQLRHDVGMVFQGYNLFPHLTVERNITLALTLVKKQPRDEAQTKAAEVLRLVGLTDKINSYPEQLSGGQQQRVAIARSLALSPQVMLFDEVTSALDPELTAEVLAVMEDLATRGMTMITVTHEMGFARKVANRVVFMHRGKIWESGRTSELFARPQTAEFKQFISSELWPQSCQLRGQAQKSGTAPGKSASPHSGPGLGISALTMSGSGSYRPAMGLLRSCERIHRHLGAGVRDREPAMLLRPEGAPVFKHALELLAFRGLLVQDLLKRRAQRFQDFGAEQGELRAGGDKANKCLGVARIITGKHVHHRVRAGRS